MVKMEHVERMRAIHKIRFRREGKAKVTNIAERKITKTKKNSMKKANTQRGKDNREIEIKAERTTGRDNGSSTTRDVTPQ